MNASITIFLLCAVLFYVCSANVQAETNITKKPDGGCGAGGNCTNPDLGCKHNGDLYESGVSFKNLCNTCRYYKGIVRCTHRRCRASINRAETRQQCIKGGKAYADFSTFKHDCKTCTCRRGRVTCTKKDCGNGCYFKGKRYTAGEKFKNECDEMCSCKRFGRRRQRFGISCKRRSLRCFSGRCLYGGKMYNFQETVPGESICEKCKCIGNVQCDRKLCKPK